MTEPRPYRWKLDGTVVETPEGYESFVPTVARHQTYRGIFQLVAGQTIGFDKDGKTYIDAKWDAKRSEAATALVVEEYNHSTYAYESYIEADLDYADYDRDEVVTYVGIKSVSFTQKLLNADKTPINLQSGVDLDGEAIVPFSADTQEITLHSQVLPVRLRAENSETQLYNLDGTNVYGVFGFSTDDMVFDEIKQRFNYPVLGATSILPGELIVAQERGDLNLDIFVTCEENIGGGGTDFANVELVLVVNSGTPTNLTKTVIPGAFNQATYEYTGTLAVEPGDAIRLYWFNTGVDTESFNWLPHNTGLSIVSYVDITQETIAEETTARVWLIWEYLLRICQAITGQNDCLRSTIYGRTDGEVYTYEEDGKYSLRGLTNGAVLRGFDWLEKPVIGSLLNAFENLRAIDNIGLGVRKIGDNYYVIIEELEYFYDADNVLFTLTNVPFVRLKNHEKLIFNRLNFGYREWQREAQLGLDTPNTTRDYSTGIRQLDNEYTAQADWITAGTYLEQTKRKRYIDGSKQDDRADDKTFLIDLVRDGSDLVPAKDEAFTAVTGISNSDTVYNMKLTPARMLLRHACVFKGCLNIIQDKVVQFQAGSGNYQATTRLTTESAPLEEDQDYAYDDLADPLFLPVLGDTEHEITKEQFALVQANPEGCIVLEDAQGNSFKGFVEKLGIEDMEEKKASIELLKVYEPPI